MFKHLALFSVALSKRRLEVQKPIKVIIPEPQILGNLETDCREIIDPQPEDDGTGTQQGKFNKNHRFLDFYQDGEDGG